MATLSSTDMAFSGFELVQRRPKMMLAWVVFLLVFSFVVGLLAASTFGPALIRMGELSAQSEPSVVLAQLGTILPFELAFAIVGLALLAVLMVSAYRALLRPDQGGPYYLSFGAPELRQMLLFIVLALLGLTFEIVGGIGAGIVTAIGAVLGRMIGGVAGGAVAGLSIAAAIIGFIGALLYCAVRLSLAAPATFMSGELVVFRTWRMTKGRFWALFGGYFLNVIVALVFEIVVGVVSFLVISGGFNVHSFMAFNQARVGSIDGFLAPASLGLTILGACIGAPLYAFFLTPPAYAYRVLAEAARAPAAAPA